MSLSGINFSGLGSGIDTESIIQQLLKLQQRPITMLQNRQQQVQSQQTGIAQISAILSGFQAAASSLNHLSSFSLVKGASSDATVATITADSGAQAGSHTLQVHQMAQAQKLGGASRSSQTEALGVSGQIVLNGKAINVSTSDSLQTIAANINSAKVGVSASVISTETNRYTLVLSSKHSGTANTISLSDTAGGTILQTTLGLIGAGTSLRNPITNGAASNLFSDSSTSVGTLIGLTAPQSGTIQIDGTDVAIDFATDSLTAIATKINAAGIAGVTASVVTATDPASGASKQRLQIVGASTPTFTDANNILTNLGILQNTPTHELVAARDARFTLDGLEITRSSNTITDVLSGVTIKLLKDAASPTTQIDIVPDTAAIKENIQTFVNQYNQLVRTVNNLASFDSQTLTSGPLFGDVTVQNVVNSITEVLTGTIPGLTGSKVLLAQIGITLDNTGVLNVNDAELMAALESNLSEVAKIFQAVGVTTDSSISYIASTEKTKASTSAGYAIEITQLATQAGVTAGTSHTADDNPDVEVLTFTGAQFGASGYSIHLNPYSSLDGIISQINADRLLSNVVTASRLGDRLVLTAKNYGSDYNFTVVSSQAAANNNSGIGNTPLTGTGLDVAGTIHGEAATGKGQILTGSSGNANTDGLQIRVTSTTTGSKGTITFTKGVADRIKHFAQGATDFINGSLTLYSNALSEQIGDIDDQIARLREQIKNEEIRLRTRFAAMEAAVTRIRAAASGLAGLRPVS